MNKNLRILFPKENSDEMDTNLRILFPKENIKEMDTNEYCFLKKIAMK